MDYEMIGPGSDTTERVSRAERRGKIVGSVTGFRGV
jgi:hypothetical protein